MALIQEGQGGAGMLPQAPGQAQTGETVESGTMIPNESIGGDMVDQQKIMQGVMAQQGELPPISQFVNQ
jgi:hypothetical protein